MMINRLARILITSLALKIHFSSALNPSLVEYQNRRIALSTICKTVACCAASLGTCSQILLQHPDPALAETRAIPPYSPIKVVGESLAAKLSKRDASVLRNSVFNIPPGAQVYPEFMRGEWSIESKFRGFLFPSTTISKEQITKNFEIPGFQKCSIASISDVGKERTTYRFRIDTKTGLEDKQFNLAQIIDGNLGYDAVDTVLYDAMSNPNRVSVNFVKNRTRNAERIELFYNARESELVSVTPTAQAFFCSEYIRQVTFSLSQEFGVARQVIGNYAHFWTWRKQEDGMTMTGNLLTAVYLDPQDPLFFNEPSKPVVVYSQDLVAQRLV